MKKLDMKERFDLKTWGEKELDLYVDQHATDSNPEKLGDLQVAYGLFLKYLDMIPINNPSNVVSFLSKFMLQRPLTPIDFNDELFKAEWAAIDDTELDGKYYISLRMPSLLMRMDDKGNKTFIDTNRVICHDVTGDSPMSSTYVDDDITGLISAKIPIRFPYYGDSKIHVVCARSVHGDDTELTFIKSARDSLTGMVYDINLYLVKCAGSVAIIKPEEINNFLKGGNK